jgi:hypothetical protein
MRPVIFPFLRKLYYFMWSQIEVYLRSPEEARDLIQNFGVGLSMGRIKAWGVDECKDAVIGCGPVIETDLRRLGFDSVPDFDSWVLGYELD